MGYRLVATVSLGLFASFARQTIIVIVALKFDKLRKFGDADKSNFDFTFSTMDASHRGTLRPRRLWVIHDVEEKEAM